MHMFFFGNGALVNSFIAKICLLVKSFLDLIPLKITIEITKYLMENCKLSSVVHIFFKYFLWDIFNGQLLPKSVSPFLGNTGFDMFAH